MAKKISIDLGNVQKTLFLPLWGRAVESKKAHPLLVDPVAEQIIDAVDYNFSSITQNINMLSQIAWIVRSIYTDEVIAGFIQEYPGATIVNIGCGLDTTFDRIDNGSLRWYDLDLPDVIELRRKFIQETDRRRYITASFLDETWLHQIGDPEWLLCIAAGVLYYFKENQVKGFLIRLADFFPGSQILFDVSSPTGVKVSNRAVIKSAGLDERSNLVWGLDRVEELLAWDGRFKLIDTYFYYRCKKLRLPLSQKLMGAFSDLIKIQYMLHLQLGVKG
jgi:O-methyltransferase involved in polyketide biosynthesis